MAKKAVGRRPKTLVFSFDGTGNEPSQVEKFTQDQSITNVLKLHILLGGGLGKDLTHTTTESKARQVTHYYSGIGTREGVFRRTVNSIFAPTWGEASRILRQATATLRRERFQPNDRLVVFGFSRGAALARKFASTVLEQEKYQRCEVSFLGVFDTVAAMDGIQLNSDRISSDVLFENGTLNERIKRAVHLVSLDEDRAPFAPTLINVDRKAPDRILEVWFPGVHSDVGGGYWMDGLADNALQFMINECKKTLGDDIELADGMNSGVIEKLLTDQRLDAEEITADDVIVYPLARGVVHVHEDSRLPRELRSVHVCEDDDAVVGDDAYLPLLHESVKDRFDAVAGYRPAAVRGVKFRLLKDGDPSAPINGIAGLRGYQQ